MSSSIDWYEAESLSDAGTQISIPYSSLAVEIFAIDGQDDTLLIDSGIGVGNLAEFVYGLTDSDPLLVLTHSHWDHIGNAYQFERTAMHPNEITTDGRVAIDSLSDAFINSPDQFVADQREEGLPFPADFDPDTFEILPADNVDSIEPDEVIDLGDRLIEIIALPGHSPGHIGFLDRTDSVLYAGDAVRGDGEILAYFENSNLGAYRETVKRLCELRDEGAFDILVSSHGGHFKGEDLTLLDELADALDAIVADELDFTAAETDRDSKPIRQYETEYFEIKTKRGL